MGLDMYAYRMTDFQPSTPTDFGSELSELREHNIEAEEFHYWRKHPDMHGLMEKIYREKEGKEETFNCTPGLRLGHGFFEESRGITERRLHDLVRFLVVR
jgi:hypothetical protein